MAVNIFYKASVEKDLKKIPCVQAVRILDKFEREARLGRSGEALKGEFEGLLKLRIGDYRVIYTKVTDGLLVLRISHRKESYRHTP